MSNIYLQVTIPSDRQTNQGQPPAENIAVDSYIYFPKLLNHTVLETARFSNWEQKNSTSCRYYHLLDLRDQFCICLESNSTARYSYKLYTSRKLVIPDDKFAADLFSFNDLPSLRAHLNKISYLRIKHNDSKLNTQAEIIARINCIEQHQHKVRIYCSLRMPQLLLPMFSSSQDYQNIDLYSKQISNDSYSITLPNLFHELDIRLSITLLSNDSEEEYSFFALRSVNVFDFKSNVAEISFF